MEHGIISDEHPAVDTIFPAFLGLSPMVYMSSVLAAINMRRGRLSLRGNLSNGFRRNYSNKQ